MPTATLKNTLIEAAPFASEAATLACSSCFQLLAFPSSAKGVKCPSCSSVTTHVKANCKGCGKKCKIRLGTAEHKCEGCKLVFTGINKMTIDTSEDSVAKRSVMLFVDVESYSPVGLKITTRIDVVAVLNQPLRSSIEVWESKRSLGLPKLVFMKDGKILDTGKTPASYDLQSFDVLEAKVRVAGQPATSVPGAAAEVAKSSTLHDFVSAQYGVPTNCACCKEFIWGIFKQGKKCSKCQMPVHHRCANKVTMMCDSHLKELFGVVDFTSDPSVVGAEADGSPSWVMGVAVSEEDKEAFVTLLDEAVEPDCDPAVMSSLNTLTNFTDEQIKQMWVHYDDDESGVLERDEMYALIKDLLSSSGGKWTDENVSLSKEDAERQNTAVDRLIARMDSNGDGLIQWEEFWNFFKAQQDANYLKQFGSKLADLSTEDLYAIWNNYDADGSGELELDEILALLGDLLGLGVSNEGRHAGCFETYLQPGAKLTWEEFYDLIVPLMAEGAAHAPKTTIKEPEAAARPQEPQPAAGAPAEIYKPTYAPPLDASADNEFQPRIIAMYMHYAPDKLPMLKPLLASCINNKLLLEKLVATYGPEPGSPTSAPATAYVAPASQPATQPATQPLVYPPTFNPADKPRIEAMYHRYAPDKLSTLDSIICVFPHDKANMLQMLVEKYGPEPYYQIVQKQKK